MLIGVRKRIKEIEKNEQKKERVITERIRMKEER